MHGRRERRGEPDAAVAIPVPVNFDGREEERQRGRAMTCSTPRRHLVLLRCGRSHASMPQSSRVCTQVTDWPVV